MGGFDSAAVRAGLGPGDTLTPIVILAIGRPDSTADLPAPPPPARAYRGPGTKSATCCYPPAPRPSHKQHKHPGAFRPVRAQSSTPSRLLSPTLRRRSMLR